MDDTSSRQALAARIRDRRRALRWSQVYLAQRAGISQALVAQIETARTRPGLDVLTRIAQVLDLDMGELVRLRFPQITSLVMGAEGGQGRMLSGVNA